MKHYSHYISDCKYHIVFCPKYRRSVLTEAISYRLKELLCELQADKYTIVEMEIMPDHVHLLLEVSPYCSPVDVVKHIKHQTAKVLRKEFPELKTKLPNLWTRSAYISSVGSVSLETVKAYIQNQKGK